MNSYENRPTIIVVNGTSGSGKTDFAEFLDQNLDAKTALFSEDDFFYNHEGDYIYDHSLLDNARQLAIDNLSAFLEQHPNGVGIYHGVVEKQWQWQRFCQLTVFHGATMNTMVLENRHGNSSRHPVPVQDLLRQQQAIEDNLRLLPSLSNTAN